MLLRASRISSRVTKEASLPAVAGLLGRLGRFIVQKPMSALSAGATGLMGVQAAKGIVSGAKSGARGFRPSMPRPPMVSNPFPSRARAARMMNPTPL